MAQGNRRDRWGDQQRRGRTQVRRRRSRSQEPRGALVLARYCLDASFVLALLLPVPLRREAIKRWSAIQPNDDVLAPSLLLAECTSVLSETAYRKNVPAEQARALVEAAARMPVRLVNAPAAFLRAFDIARSLGHAKAYDALYLATAQVEDAQLLTADRGMSEAAARLAIRATLVH